MFNRSRCRLRVLKGESPGRDLAVSASPFTIGSDAECDLILADASVRPQHAVLEEESEGHWTLRNLGPRGVLVNQNPVSSTLLSDGDLIQIGAATLLSFQVAEAAAKTPAAAGTPATPPAVNPVLLAVLGVVVALSVAFLILAPRLKSAAGDDSDALTPTLMAEVLQETRDCLLGDDLLKSYRAPMTRVEKSSDPAVLFYVLIAMRQRGAEAAKVTDWIDQQLLDPARRQLTQAWLLESQDRLGEARQAYRRLVEALPDLRCPATRYAAYRQAVLADQIATRQKRR